MAPRRQPSATGDASGPGLGQGLSQGLSQGPNQGLGDGHLIQLEGVTRVFARQGGAPEALAEGESAEHVTVLHGVTLDITPGEFTALQGTSGSGKSTLLHILGLLDRASAGSYRLHGKDVSRLSDDALSGLRSRHIGFVFQSFYLIPYATALENVLMPGLYTKTPQRQLIHRARELLGMVGLGDRTHHKPSQLSGGQQQRVALARALINAPSLLLADEPTGQLDSRTSKEIMQLFRDVNAQGATVIVVTHDPEVAAYAKRRLHMEDGRIVQDERDAAA